MKRFGGFKVVAAIGLMSASVLGGCVVAPAPAPGYYSGAVVMVAPPEPRVEVVGVAPAPGYVWFPGYWNWNGGAHVWVGGHWGAGRPGYYWAPHVWVHTGGGWRMSGGHWERR
jgi:hypothetical protein